MLTRWCYRIRVHELISSLHRQACGIFSVSFMQVQNRRGAVVSENYQSEVNRTKTQIRSFARFSSQDTLNVSTYITTSPISPSFTRVRKTEIRKAHPVSRRHKALGVLGGGITHKPSRRVSNSNSYWHSRFPHLSSSELRPALFRVRKVDTVRSRWFRGISEQTFL